jgi:hypothetical protein
MLLLGLVVVIATLGGSYAAMQLSHGSPTAKSDTSEKAEVVKLDPTSVPVVRAGKIQGYVIGRFAFSASGGEIKKNKDALVQYVSEAIFRSVYEETELDFATLKIIEVEKLVGRIVAKANERIGRAAITEVFVESMNFLAHDAVRCQPTK